ncbi:hypothetical protein HMPREF1556_00908 [Porphyromonas sp. oral taxon 278 str. W7784]|nr:hypothetical protein HMPREF1556_00908 [Porphyromonas sp. oral taxon 278 str. W7784]
MESVPPSPTAQSYGSSRKQLGSLCQMSDKKKVRQKRQMNGIRRTKGLPDQ